MELKRFMAFLVWERLSNNPISTAKNTDDVFEEPQNLLDRRLLSRDSKESHRDCQASQIYTFGMRVFILKGTKLRPQEAVHF